MGSGNNLWEDIDDIVEDGIGSVGFRRNHFTGEQRHLISFQIEVF